MPRQLAKRITTYCGSCFAYVVKVAQTILEAFVTPYQFEMTCENAFENRALTVNRALSAPLSGTAIDSAQFAKLVWEISDPATHEAIREASYARTLFQLQCELVKLQRWVHAKKLKIVVIFEGRDAAGKGGMIKRITHRLDPRLCRVVALGTPNERERAQWYFQRYVTHLPTGGEIVFFDHSWYNRAGVERVMGFCSDRDDSGVIAPAIPEISRPLIPGLSRPPVPELCRPSIPELIRPPVEAA